MTDRRRFGVIEVRRINAETYWLEIGGRMWSEVEWSRSRKMWCVQDAAGHCLVHCEHIVGQDRDVQTAIRLAKKMIIDGSMPSPEDARAQLQAEQDKRKDKRKQKPTPEYLGEPCVMDGPRPVSILKKGG
jgi:hypothetical protein